MLRISSVGSKFKLGGGGHEHSGPLLDTGRAPSNIIWILFDYIFFRIKRAPFILIKMLGEGEGGGTCPHSPRFLLRCFAYPGVKNPLLEEITLLDYFGNIRTNNIISWEPETLFSLLPLRCLQVRKETSAFLCIPLPTSAHAWRYIPRQRSSETRDIRVNHEAIVECFTSFSSGLLTF